MVAPRCIKIFALVTLGLTGCTSLQDIHYSLVNKSRAEYAWYSNTTLSQRWSCGADYAHGYRKGFSDASTGRGCTLPAVPPPCYWSTKYQCCEGQKQIQDWYRGYQCGVAAAQGSGFPSFHTIPVGPQAPVVNKDGCGMCYSPTGCLCESTSSPEATFGDSGATPEPGLIESTFAEAQPRTSGWRQGLIGPAGTANDLMSTPSIRTASAERPSAELPIIR